MSEPISGELFELEQIGLTTEQEIRAGALHAAVRLVAGGAIAYSESDDLLDVADDFAAYIRDGRHAAEQ